jgi:hypothetical protein
VPRCGTGSRTSWRAREVGARELGEKLGLRCSQAVAFRPLRTFLENGIETLLLVIERSDIDTTLVNPSYAARFVRQHWLDGSPLMVGESCMIRSSQF